MAWCVSVGCCCGRSAAAGFRAAPVIWWWWWWETQNTAAPVAARDLLFKPSLGSHCVVDAACPLSVAVVVCACACVCAALLPVCVPVGGTGCVTILDSRQVVVVLWSSCWHVCVAPACTGHALALSRHFLPNATRVRYTAYVYVAVPLCVLACCRSTMHSAGCCSLHTFNSTMSLK